MADKIYCCATGLDSVIASGNITETTNNIVTGFSFISLQVPNDNSSTFRVPIIDPDTGASAAPTEFWLHFVAAVDSGNNGTLEPVFRLVDASNTNSLQITCSGQGTVVYNLQKWVSGAWVTVTGDAPSPGYSTNAAIDLYVKLDASVGHLELFINGTSYIVFSGDTSALVAPTQLVAPPLPGNGNHHLQQAFIANFNTIGHTARVRKVTANGTDQDWAGDFSNIDNFPLDPNSFITSQTAGDVSDFVATTLSATPAGQKIRGVILNASSRHDTTGPQNVNALVRISGTDYNAPYNMAHIGLGLSGASAIYMKNPATSAAWASITEANCGLGVESVA